MTIAALQALYDTARRTDDFDVHKEFTDALLASNDAAVLNFHYDILRDRSNRDLYLRARAAFARRPAAAGDYLAHRAQTEQDPAMRADILHLLGLMRHPAALPMARAVLEDRDKGDADPDMRHRACYVLGWLGQAQDIATLGEVLLHDPDPFVRRTAATSHSQFYEHARRSKNTLLRNLGQALQSEQDPQVVGWIVLSVQYILEKRFGIRWDSEEDRLLGDAAAARDKCVAALRKLLKA